MSEYFSIYLCEKCRKHLSFNVVMYSHGCCPECGNNSGDSIVNTRRKSIRRTSPWWRFWDETFEDRKGNIIK